MKENGEVSTKDHDHDHDRDDDDDENEGGNSDGQLMLEGGNHSHMPTSEAEDADLMKLKQMSKEDIKKLKFDKEVMKMKNKFIGTLKIPCYDNCRLFYYYDVLEALSRHLFQNIIF